MTFQKYFLFIAKQKLNIQLCRDFKAKTKHCYTDIVNIIQKYKCCDYKVKLQMQDKMQSNNESFKLLELSDDLKSLSDLELPEIINQRKRKVRR